jgi:AraC family transcriptional regulator
MFRSLMSGGPIHTARPIRSAEFSVLIQGSEPARLPPLYGSHHVVGVPLGDGYPLARGDHAHEWRGRLEPGDVSIHAAGPGEGVTWPEGARCMYIHLHSAIVDREAARQLDAASVSLQTIPRHRDARIREIGVELYQMVHSRLIDDVAVRALIDGLVSRLVSAYGVPPAPKAMIGGLTVEALLDRVRVDEATAGSMTRLAAACGLTRAHFTRRFSAIVGASPYTLLLASRVERAKYLLASSRTSIAAVAAACGFADQAHLSRTFSRLTGTTPARFRAASPGVR